MNKEEIEHLLLSIAFGLCVTGLIISLLWGLNQL